MTSLQRDANRLFGFTANQTLEVVQRLYENKLTTYPRTDSRFLTEDMEDTAKSIISVICETIPFAQGLNFEPNIKPLMNNKKVSDHHAIIPTANIKNYDFSKLTDTDRKILYLISHRLVAAAAEKYIYESTNVTLDCNGTAFYANGKRIIKGGFREIEDKFRRFLSVKNTEDNAENNASEETFPELNNGMHLPATPEITERFTSPPKAFTEDTLLSAMERAGSEDYETDEVERKGLGTPATRAGIIETIISRGYVKRSGKQLVSTEKGQNLIKIVPENIRSAKMTAEWENRLVLISKGETSDNDFMSDISYFVRKIVSDTRVVDEMKDAFNSREVIGYCPRCGSPVYEGKLNFYCSNKNCDFALWKNNRYFESMKKTITKATAVALLKNGKVHFKDLYSAKKDKTFEADIVMDPNSGKYISFSLEFNNFKNTGTRSKK